MIEKNKIEKFLTVKMIFFIYKSSESKMGLEKGISNFMSVFSGIEILIESFDYYFLWNIYKLKIRFIDKKIPVEVCYHISYFSYHKPQQREKFKIKLKNCKFTLPSSVINIAKNPQSK